MTKKTYSSENYRTDKVKKRERERILKLQENELTIEQIAEKVGRNKKTVQKVLKEAKNIQSVDQEKHKDNDVQYIYQEKLKEHFNELAEVAGMLLANELETVRPNQWKDRQEFQDILYWIGYDVEGQEGIKNPNELCHQLDENIITTASTNYRLLVECLILHIDVELAESTSKGFHELRWHDPYVVIDILRVLSYRKTFKGTCQICEKW